MYTPRQAQEYLEQLQDRLIPELEKAVKAPTSASLWFTRDPDPNRLTLIVSTLGTVLLSELLMPCLKVGYQMIDVRISHCVDEGLDGFTSIVLHLARV